ncbi:Hypothetical protein SRAE_2000069000 [Strongyloides ratti]|uniref:7TM GPCR, serpentine receptor class v (Srv) family-containing protein n=1 Tax=Strongyloides ratti TaxID=34506 RepID=A0A090L8D9_STRRB|nr:Hypothetical protein SRAE_2000069000 [Strongyloides ratti]CEF66017.1 Hypothetical protein SRAE_2000069000 [Strongyloides ratti]
MVSVIGIIRCIIAYFSSFVPISPYISAIFIPYKPSYEYGLLNFSFYYFNMAHFTSTIMLLLNLYQAFDDNTKILSNNIFFEIFSVIILPIPGTFYLIEAKSQFQLTNIYNSRETNNMVLVMTTRNVLTNSMPQVIKFCYIFYFFYSLILMGIVMKRFINIKNKKNKTRKMILAFLHILFQYPYLGIKYYQFLFKSKHFESYFYVILYFGFTTFLSTVSLIIPIIIVDKNSRHLFYFKQKN